MSFLGEPWFPLLTQPTQTGKVIKLELWLLEKWGINRELLIRGEWNEESHRT